MDAGGGRRDFRDDGQLSSGPGVTVHEAVEHAGARGLADGGGDRRDGVVDSLDLFG